jgi:hypothetical protein
MKNALKNLKTRIWDNWIASLAGLLLGVGMGILLYLGKITFDNFCFILPTILILLGVKDTLFGVKHEKDLGQL